MKQKTIILRLCLFLLAIVLTAPAWSKSETWQARNRNKGENEGTRTSADGIVTVSWSNCKTGRALLPANRNWVMAPGSTVTITCQAGWRVRALYISDQLKNESKLICENPVYVGNGSTGIRNYEAPRNSITLRANNSKVEFAKYTVEYVQESPLSFKNDSYTIGVDRITDPLDGYMIHNPDNRVISVSIDNTDVAFVWASRVKGKKVGQTMVNVYAHPNDDYAASSATAIIKVVRNDIDPTLEWTSNTMKAWEILQMPKVSNMPWDYPTDFSLWTFTSSDENTVKPVASSNTLTFGGSGYGKTATITVNIPETNSYNAKTLTYTVSVDNEMRIASKEDWQTFCNQIRQGNKSINATMTADIDLGTTITMAATSETNKYSGTFDGAGHSIKMNWTGSGWVAPFNLLENATVKNLRTRGQITMSKYYFMSGLALEAYGTVTISNCISEVNLTSNSNGSAHGAGLLTNVRDKANVTINDCIVSGTFNGTTENSVRNWAGFVNHKISSSTLKLNNCLYTGTNNAGRSNTFANSDAELNNCYYLNPCGSPQGIQVKNEQLKNGYTAKGLQGNRTDKCHWAQVLGENPSFYNEADKTKTNYVYYDVENARWTCDKFQITDGVARAIGIDFIAGYAESLRGFPASSDHGYTVCLPFDYPIEYGFKAYTLSGGTGTQLHFTEVTGTMEAYKPYYIVPDGLAMFTGNNLQVRAFNTDALKITAGDYSFMGTVSGMTNSGAVAANAYILQDDNLWHKVTMDNTSAYIPAYRAYITSATAGAKALSFTLGNEATGISTVVTTDADGTQRVYDLNGRLLDSNINNLPKGVYVVNGKKVMK
ncbi:MAG: hypothetical protein MR681_01945 [Prevotella sp.]|nr:hypothetical protein [Prevotella sp.]